MLEPGLPPGVPSVLQHSAFFMVQVLYPYMTTGKTTALTIWTFVGKVMYLFLLHCLGFPSGLAHKEFACQFRRHKRCGFDPWVWKIP